MLGLLDKCQEHSRHGRRVTSGFLGYCALSVRTLLDIPTFAQWHRPKHAWGDWGHGLAKYHGAVAALQLLLNVACLLSLAPQSVQAPLAPVMKKHPVQVPLCNTTARESNDRIYANRFLTESGLLCSLMDLKQKLEETSGQHSMLVEYVHVQMAENLGNL